MQGVVGGGGGSGSVASGASRLSFTTGAPAGAAQAPAADAPPCSQQRLVGVRSVSVSRTGREPGASKTNQDTYVAVEALPQLPQLSLFGAFDGHGPNGARARRCYRGRLLPCAMPACAEAILIHTFTRARARPPHQLSHPTSPPRAGHAVSGYLRSHLPALVSTRLVRGMDAATALPQGECSARLPELALLLTRWAIARTRPP